MSHNHNDRKEAKRRGGFSHTECTTNSYNTQLILSSNNVCESTRCVIGLWVTLSCIYLLCFTFTDTPQTPGSIASAGRVGNSWTLHEDSVVTSYIQDAAVCSSKSLQVHINAEVNSNQRLPPGENNFIKLKLKKILLFIEKCCSIMMYCGTYIIPRSNWDLNAYFHTNSYTVNLLCW